MDNLPATYRAFRRTSGKGSLEKPLSIEQTTEKIFPEGATLGLHDVVIRIRAVSLNYRDVAILDGRYQPPSSEKGVPTSDCAAEVVAIGSAVTDFRLGDRVCPIIALGNITGQEENIFHTMPGCDIDGVLREYAVYEDKVLVRLPKNLSWEEIKKEDPILTDNSFITIYASTISCAGVTAWNALRAPGSFGQGKTALLQGTGGVSMFALLIALAGGIKPIITSSSDEKLAAINKLAPEGKILAYNYKTSPDQAATVKNLTNGKGVDIILNNAGPPSIPADIKSLCRYGSISIVGRLEVVEADWNPAELIRLVPNQTSLVGIAVGPKVDFEALNRFIEENNIRLEAIIDKVFDFEDSKAAFDYLKTGKHVGKVVIKL